MFLENFFCAGIWRVGRVHVVFEVSDCLSDEIEFALRRKRKDHF
jgi:hypothetical protein